MAKNQDHRIVDLYQKGLKAQSHANSNFWANSAFIRGHQWVHFNPSNRRLEEVPDDDRVRATINRLWPGSRTIMSKLVQRRLQFEVQPNSADDVAIHGSKIAESILEAVKKEHQWEDLRESVGWSLWKGGTAAIAIDWNPSKGKPTALADDGRKLPSGDTEETALSLAEFVIQPGARLAESAEWWIKAQALPPSQVKAKYGLSDEPPADATTGLSPLERGLVFANALGDNSPTSTGQGVDLTLVLTYYERPNPNSPNGSVEVVVDNKTVWGPKEWPFPFVDYLNIATARETIVENTWMGETVVSIARPVQAAYNAAWSNILEHVDLAGNARLMVPHSAYELSEQYSDKIGEQILYMDNMDKPAWLSPPSLPGWLLQLPSQLRDEIDDILGVHDISRGSAPANIESGYGLAVLAEQDSTPLGKMSSSMAAMFSRVASMVLKLYEANVKETRTAVISMPGMPPETTPWSGSDLAGQTEAVVPAELVAPRSRAAQAQFAEKALQMGLINSLEDMVRLAEAPGEREILAAVRPDVDRARRENAAMAQGKVEFPEDFDNHALHIAEHNAFRKTARYEALPAQIKDIYAAHNQAHETMAAEAAARQQKHMLMGGHALANAPKSDAADQEVTLDPNAPPPAADQTVMDQLSGSIANAVNREDAQASSEGAAIDQQNNERDAVLQLANVSQGMGT